MVLSRLRKSDVALTSSAMRRQNESRVKSYHNDHSPMLVREKAENDDATKLQRLKYVDGLRSMAALLDVLLINSPTYLV